MAVDWLGREIIVPQPSPPFDPRAVTDACGSPTGDRLEGEATVTVCLAYHECDAEPVPVLVGDCDTEKDCAPSTVRERYKVLVLEGEPPAAGVECGMPELFAPGAGDEDALNRHARLAERVSQACPEVEGNACIVLAQIDLPDAGQAITAEMVEQGCRPVVYSNELLMELLICLAERVEACCRTRILRYLSGDAQEDLPEAVLAQPLVVEVVDGEGNPVADEPVRFHIQGGEGGVGDGGGFAETYTVQTDADGRTEAHWRLGPVPGLNTLAASIASGSQVVFHALAEKTEMVPPPVVNAVWPPNAVNLDPEGPEERIREWFQSWQKPRLEITFDRRMAEECLKESEKWLRVWEVRSFGENEIRVRRIPLAYEGPADDPVLPADGVTAIYRLEVESAEELLGARFLIQMRAEEDAIVDTGVPAQLLDADFNGTKVTKALLAKIWQVEDQEWFEQVLWDSLVDTGRPLPSGDGEPGGHFHGWFAVAV
jgi:hypothetical protein